MEVEDHGHVIARFESGALGGKATAQPFDVPNGPTVAQIEDPEGNLVNLVQM